MKHFLVAFMVAVMGLSKLAFSQKFPDTTHPDEIRLLQDEHYMGQGMGARLMLRHNIESYRFARNVRPQNEEIRNLKSKLAQYRKFCSDHFASSFTNSPETDLSEDVEAVMQAAKLEYEEYIASLEDLEAYFQNSDEKLSPISGLLINLSAIEKYSENLRKLLSLAKSQEGANVHFGKEEHSQKASADSSIPAEIFSLYYTYNLGKDVFDTVSGLARTDLARGTELVENALDQIDDVMLNRGFTCAEMARGKPPVVACREAYWVYKDQKDHLAELKALFNSLNGRLLAATKSYKELSQQAQKQQVIAHIESLIRDK